MQEENIAAIATAAGRGGVAIIRVSGKTALALAAKMLSPSPKSTWKILNRTKCMQVKLTVGILPISGYACISKPLRVIRARTSWNSIAMAEKIWHAEY